MSTINGNSTTNAVNWVLYSYSTQFDYHTDRAVGTFSLHDIVQSVVNLGVGATATNPFTNLT